MNVGDAADELRSKSPKFVVVLDTLVFDDATAQVAHKEFTYSKADIILRIGTVVVHRRDVF